MASHFSGFTPATVNFLRDLKSNNVKSWFDAHKSDYEKYVKEPSLALIATMNERFADLGVPYISTPKASMFRIYRDVRFSKNKDPYKTNIGLFFPFSHKNLDNRPVEAPGVYLHIDPDEIFIGGGLHMPMPEQLRSIRERIADEWKDLEAITKSPKFLSEFPKGLRGESLQRVPRGYAQDHPAADLLKLKQFGASAKISEKEIATEQIIDIIESKSLTIAPLLVFLAEALTE